MKLREHCKSRRRELNLTNQEIADSANLPVNTVNHFFSISSKSPSIYTVASICQVLGVSLDHVFGISPADCTPESERALFERMLASARHGIRIRNILLLGLTVCLALALVYALFLDSNLAGFGFIQR